MPWREWNFQNTFEDRKKELKLRNTGLTAKDETNADLKHFKNNDLINWFGVIP